MKFAIVKKGYDAKAVDEYIAVKDSEHKDQISTCKKRNALLCEQVEELERQLDAAKRNESQVTQLLVDAKQLLTAAEQNAARYAAEEQERLSQFREKWVRYATAYLHRELADFAAQLETYRQDYGERVQARLNTNLFLLADPLYADYRSEEKRTESASDTPVHIEELLERLKGKDKH